MKSLDLDRERSEKTLTRDEFIACYNEDLPDRFQKATPALLRDFEREFPDQRLTDGTWSLHHHRKKLLDWHLQLGTTSD